MYLVGCDSDVSLFVEEADGTVTCTLNGSPNWETFQLSGSHSLSNSDVAFLWGQALLVLALAWCIKVIKKRIWPKA